MIYRRTPNKHNPYFIFSMIAWFNGNFVEKDSIRIDPDDRGFLFGDGVYDVVRVYHGKSFRLNDHLQRMLRNCGELALTAPAMAILSSITGKLLEKNLPEIPDGNAIIYYQVTRGRAPRTHAFPDPPVPETMLVTMHSFYTDPDKLENGVNAIIYPDERWKRCDIKSLNLIPNVLGSQAAAVRDAYDVLFEKNGFITEGTHTSVIGVKSGEIYTHPLTRDILPGITRSVVHSICKTRGIPWNDTAIRVDELDQLDELAFLGTTTEIMPIIRVEGNPVGNGKPGPVVKRLQSEFNKLQDIREQYFVPDGT